MGIGKILGFAALGVGAVAAAPFTGGGSVLGAASLAASLTGAGAVAAGAGVAGAALGSALSNSDEAKGHRRGIEETTAKLAIKITKLNEMHKGTEEYFKTLLTMATVGIATANVDGEISDGERKDLLELIAGSAGSALPDNIKDGIELMIDNPPTLNEAVSAVKCLKNPDFEMFKQIIQIVSASDDITCEKEEAFLEAFCKSIA